MDALPLTRRHLLGGGLLLAGGWLTAQLVGHRPLSSVHSPFLGAGQHTLAAAFEAMLPAEADHGALASGVDDFLAGGDPVLGGQLRLALTVLEHTAGAGVLQPRRFSRLSVERRRALLDAWRASTLAPKRQIADALRRVALFTWYSHPDSWATIGYDGPWVGLMIRTGQDVPAGFTVRTDVCVIGSGAGGGVAAALLAEAGREVFVLEEGPHVPGAAMTQREDEMYPLLYRDGGEQRTADGGISVLQGRVVGGSTVVNMADVVGMHEHTTAHWRDRFGLTRWSHDDLVAAEAICREVIGANRIARSQLNHNNALLVRGGEAMGLPTATMDHNRTACIGSGYCLVGCAYDAKRSVALTWIPRALHTGRTTVQAEARVHHLEHDEGRITAVVGHVVRPTDSAELAPFRVEADTVVLAAGSIHSPLLLAASDLGGDHVGQHLSLQPQAPVAAIFPDDVVMFRGIPQAGYVDAETTSVEHGLGGFRLEGVSATPGMAAVSTALGTEALHAFMASYRRVAACLCLVPDRPTGRVIADRHGRPTIRYALSPATERTLKEAIRTAARCYLAAGAELVTLPFPDAEPVRTEADLQRMDRLRILPASSPLISAHPQGTCRMGPDPATSVVGLDGRVHGTHNLYVTDGSVFPTTASSHTQLPIMAWSWLAATALAEAPPDPPGGR